MSKEIFYMPQSKFPLGEIVITTAADTKLAPLEISRAVMRHCLGDWGDVSDDDKAANERAVQDGSRLLSVYHDQNGVIFRIVTEADRCTTTVLLPDNYQRVPNYITMSLNKSDLELIERVIYKQGDDIAVSIGRSFERLEERLDAGEARIYSRLAELEDKIEASRQELSDELGGVREEMRKPKK